MDIREEMKSAGVYPTGPVSAWPKSRNESMAAELIDARRGTDSRNRTGVTAAKLAGNLMRTAGQAVRHGKISSEIREERYDTCKACPFFNAESKRCNDCGCFMEAKTWVGGDPDMLCPQKKWSR